MLSRIVVVLTCAASLGAQSWFDAPRVFDQYAGDVRAVGDFDRDGSPDLLRFYATASATPLFGLGRTAFQPGPTHLLALNTAQLIKVADFDGDQQPDLITSASTSYVAGAGLLFHRGLPGGNFAAPVFYPLPWWPESIVVGRGNGDALPDLAVCVRAAGGPGPTVRWLFGTQGQAPVMQAPFVFSSLFLPGSMAAFDRDGDGDDDLAIANGNGTLLLLTTQAGAMIASGALPVPIALGVEVRGLDLDGDLDDDLVVFSRPNYNSTDIVFLENQTGVLTPTTQTITANATISIHTGDIDHDGDQDLVARTQSGLAMFERVGGVFVSRATFELGIAATSGEPGLVDVDGDGHLDFVDTRSVWFGDGTFAHNPLPAEPSTFAPLDWEGDGDIDVMRSQGGLLRNDGRGTFALNGLTFPPTPGPNQEFHSGVVMGDFDGDGRREVLAPLYFRDPIVIFNVTFLGMHRLADTGSGQLIDLGVVTSGSVVMHEPAFAVDTNGDSILDVVDRNGVWVQGANHQFTLIPQPSFGSFEPIAAGDVDGDGDMDLLAGMHGTTLGIAVLRQTAPNTFTMQVVSASNDHSGPDHRGLLIDLDGDGDLDIAVDRSWASGDFEVWENQGGTFVRAWNTSLGLPPATVLTMAGDVDGDGRIDLAFEVGTSMYVYRRNGPGLTYDAPSTFYAPNISSLVDVDGDGDLDALGGQVLRNRTFVMPAAGQLRQYGASVAGSGSFRPVLGSSGPVRVGSTPVLRLRDAMGGTFTLLGMGFQEAAFPSPVLPGLIGYTYPLVLTIGFGVGGTVGVPGAGVLDVPVTIPPGFQGLQLYFQHFVFDSGAANGIAHTNGVEWRIGT